MNNFINSYSFNFYRLAQRIFGGQNATEGQFPYQVSLKYYNRHTCGGSILNERWILSAAHCINPKIPLAFVYVTAGSIHLMQGEMYDIEMMKPHPGFSFTATNNDIALLRTKKVILFTKFVNPISIKCRQVGAGQDAVTSGWGKTDTGLLAPILQFAHFKTISVDDCVSRMTDPVKVHVHNTSLCIVQETPSGLGVCSGDSGGPLVVNGKLVGVASWIADKCGGPRPNVYTKVYEYQDWIDEEMGKEESTTNL